VTLLLDIPRTRQPARVFRQMMQVARQVAHGIGGRVVDDQRQNLGDAGVRLIGERITLLENRLTAQQMVLGWPWRAALRASREVAGSGDLFADAPAPAPCSGRHRAASSPGACRGAA
jgi:hypothetical protein